MIKTELGPTPFTLHSDPQIHFLRQPQFPEHSADAVGAAPYDSALDAWRATVKRACNVCHTRTSHHRNSDSGGDHTHNIDKICANCHLHTKGFIK